VTLKHNSYTLLARQCKHETGRWRVNLAASLSALKPTPHAMYNVYDQRSIEDSIVYLHVACFSPVKDTWPKAFEAGNVAGWSGLTPDRVRKYLHKSDATVKCHMNLQRKNTRSMQEKEPTSGPGARDISRGQNGLCVCRDCGIRLNT
jgi:hypothetical protein